MVGRSRSRRQQSSRLLGNHQRCWLWGRHVVTETLRADRWKILELLLADDLEPAVQSELTELADQTDTPCRLETRVRLTQLSSTGEHQGCLARMTPFPYASLEEVLEKLSPVPFLVLLDRLQDPHNFGAIIRSAEIMNADAVLVGTSHQSPVNSQVARASTGAVNWLPLAEVEDFPALFQRVKAASLQVVGASEKAESPLFTLDLTRPTVLIIGNEGTGIRPEFLAECDALACIPQAGRVQSLNAAVSAGILFYELQRQRLQQE